MSFIFSQKVLTDFSSFLPAEFHQKYVFENLSSIAERDNEEQDINQLLSELKIVCGTDSMKKGVDHMISELKENPQKTDIIFIFSKADNKIKGFCSVKEDSCMMSKSKKVLMIQFICTNVKGISKYLLGLSLFSAKLLSFNVVGLQVDNGFENPNAYCAYLKIGFVYDPELLYLKCFSFNKKNVPMSFQLDNHTSEDILRLTLTSLKVEDELCKIEDREKQKTLGEMRQGFYIVSQCFSTESCKYKNVKEKKVVPSIMSKILSSYISADDRNTENVLTFLLQEKDKKKFKDFVVASATKDFDNTFI
jgi:hypothetical protein